MDEAGHLTVAVENGHSFLEASDDEHAAVHLEHVVGGEGNVQWLVPVHGA
jgi:hypothetical protein